MLILIYTSGFFFFAFFASFALFARNKRWYVVFLAVVGLASSAYGDTIVPARRACALSQQVSLIHESADALLAGHYRQAEELFDRFIAEKPDEPAGPLMKAAVIHYHAIDYEDYSRSDEYIRLLDTAEKLALTKVVRAGSKPAPACNLKPERCTGRFETCPSYDVWGWYFLYSARILKAAWSVTSGNFFTGVIDARAAVKGLSRIDSDTVRLSTTGAPVHFDILLTTGSYRFWQSNATKPVHWLPFIDDQRKQGIAEVEEALAKGTLVTPLSSTVLIEMLMVYDNNRAITCAEGLVARYPSCRLFRWQLGESLKRDGRYEDAVRVLIGIADGMANDPDDDGSGPLRCWWKLAVLSESLGKVDDCRRYCGEIIRIGQRKTVAERQKKRIEGARRLLEKLNND